MIIIIGDSWGVGEWSQSCELNGPGIGQYLMLHDEVINLSVGGGSNTQSLDRLKKLLVKFSPDHYDTIYWLITCPTRCISAKDFVSLTTDCLTDTATQLLNNCLQSANDLAKTFDIKIKLIGGLCDLNSVDVTQYTNLEIVVASWGQLLDPNYSTCLITDNWIEIGQIIKKENPKLLEEWNLVADKISKKHQSWQELKIQYFGTDGSHPDRRGHLVLRNYLYPQWAFKH